MNSPVSLQPPTSGFPPPASGLPPPASPVRLAVLQFPSTPLSRERNLAVAARLAQSAAAQGARLLLLPALFSSGYVYTPRLTAAAEDETGPTITWLKAQSAGLDVLLAGSLLLRQGGRVYNTLVLAEPDGRIRQYRQRNPLLWEHCYFEAGGAPLIAETALGRLGMLLSWDLAQPAAWAAYAGRVDMVLIASAPPRLHRAVLNFPGGRKAYLAQLLPVLLRRREALDELFSAHVAACASAIGVPVAQAVMSGRLVTQLPFPRLSVLAAAWRQPRYWALVRQAAQASLRATFYGGSAIYDRHGATLARVENEEGVALADVVPGRTVAPAKPIPRPPLPLELVLLNRLLRLLGRWFAIRAHDDQH